MNGIDVYYLGPEDISNSLGIPGQSKDPRVVALVEEAIRQIAARGKIAGVTGSDAAGTRRYIELGARYIACHPIRFRRPPPGSSSRRSGNESGINRHGRNLVDGKTSQASNQSFVSRQFDADCR